MLCPSNLFHSGPNSNITTPIPYKMAVTLAQFSQTIRRQQYEIYGDADMQYPQFAKPQQSPPRATHHDQIYHIPETMTEELCSDPEYYEDMADDPFWLHEVPLPRDMLAVSRPSHQGWPAFVSTACDESPVVGLSQSPTWSTYSQSSTISRSSSTNSNSTTYSTFSACSSPHLPAQTPETILSDSHAAAGPRPFLRLGRDDVWDSLSGITIYTVHRGAASFSSFLSSKPALTLRHASTSTVVGSARPHAIGNCDLVLTTPTRSTTISTAGVFRKRWNFSSVASTTRAARWSWRCDTQFGGAVLDDGRTAARHVLARVKDDVLSFEDPSLGDDACHEIVLSALALAEALRKPSRGKHSADLADIFCRTA